MITKVTITGADDSINPFDLIPLNDKYPFVEWGILVSQRNFGKNRFPAGEWLKALEILKKEHSEISLSCHLCGLYVRELSKGNDIAIKELGSIWNIFDRVQINFHAIPHTVLETMAVVLKQYPEKEFIFQYDNVNNQAVHFMHEKGVNCSALFDASGGAGILPKNWPQPLINIKCGYAGGISPENISEQILLIQEKIGDLNTWIDMETHVRSNNDNQFDLAKVEKCLKFSNNYISNHYQ